MKDSTKLPRWFRLAQTYDSENLRDFEVGELLSDNGIAQVSRGTGGYIYKRSIPFLIENEMYCLKALHDVPRLWSSLPIFVPHATRYDKYTIRMEDLGIGELVTDIDEFMSYKRPLESVLKYAKIRHGDITTQAIIVRDQKPYLIDFAESRLSSDPRLDKRPEGDAYWLDKTFMELCNTAMLKANEDADTTR